MGNVRRSLRGSGGDHIAVEAYETRVGSFGLQRDGGELSALCARELTAFGLES